MSPALLAHLRAVERDTRRLHWLAWQGDSAIYPRDYFRPADPGCYRYRQKTFSRHASVADPPRAWHQIGKHPYSEWRSISAPVDAGQG